ncbi:hypothetical protein ABTY96_03210 [Streptomyces sp. NPDC096057]|uniref:hypothetical protein n=1 Tax=Streptomyces sp. NPDC096057 TaxID=3155543 RepID=UPI00331FC468
MSTELPLERVGTPADFLAARLVRSRYADGNPLVIVVSGSMEISERTTTAHQLVISDREAAETLAHQILEEVSKWPKSC